MLGLWIHESMHLAYPGPSNHVNDYTNEAIEPHHLMGAIINGDKFVLDSSWHFQADAELRGLDPLGS